MQCSACRGSVLNPPLASGGVRAAHLFGGSRQFRGGGAQPPGEGAALHHIHPVLAHLGAPARRLRPVRHMPTYPHTHAPATSSSMESRRGRSYFSPVRALNRADAPLSSKFKFETDSVFPCTASDRCPGLPRRTFQVCCPLPDEVSAPPPVRYIISHQQILTTCSLRHRPPGCLGG